MIRALCTLDGVTYNAVDFNQTVNFSTLRRRMVCIECGGPAYYRSQGSDDRAACFVGNPHADGCSRATVMYAVSPTERAAVENRRIVVNFDFGGQHTGTVIRPTGGVAAIGTQEDQNTSCAPTRNIASRSLRSLLSELIGNEDFTSSAVTIEIPGRGEYAVANLFVSFANATADHIGGFHGFWGRIVDADTQDNTLYFNSGDQEAVSVLLDQQFHNETADRYGTENLNDFRGAYMLVFGELSLSRRGKKYVQITDQNYFTLRLNR